MKCHVEKMVNGVGGHWWISLGIEMPNQHWNYRCNEHQKDTPQQPGEQNFSSSHWLGIIFYSCVWSLLAHPLYLTVPDGLCQRTSGHPVNRLPTLPPCQSSRIPAQPLFPDTPRWYRPRVTSPAKVNHSLRQGEEEELASALGNATLWYYIFNYTETHYRRCWFKAPLSQSD